MKRKNHYKFHSQLNLPFLETHQEYLVEIFNILQLKFGLIRNSNQELIDLGSGDGRVIMHASLNHGIKSIGIEINETLVKEARMNLKLIKREKNHEKNLFKKIKIKTGDIFEEDLGKYDFIYIFSLPTMQKYLTHVFNTAKKDAIIISYKYPLKGFENLFNLEYELVHESIYQ